jgi:RNA polymerase-binding protein DksA
LKVAAKKTVKKKKKTTKKAASKTVKKVSAKVTKKTAKKAVKKTAAKKATKKAAKKTAASKATKKAVTKTVKKAVKKTSPKAATKKVKKTANKAVTKTVKKVKKTAKKAVKKVAPKKAVKKAKKKKIKTPLTRPQLKAFRKTLLEKRRSLVGDMSGMEAGALGRGRNGGGELSTMPDHPANIASDNYEQEFMLGLLESERELLGEIDDALQRIADKIYGVCLGTAKPIGMPRLRARPWSKYCIDYARLIEQGKVAPGEGILEAGAAPGPDED